MLYKLKWYCYMYGFRQFGWIGLLGIGLCLFSLVFYASSVRHMRTELANESHSLNQIRAKAPIEDKPAETHQDDHASLNTYIDQFPSQAKVNLTLEEITKIAEKSGLMLDHSAFEISPKLNGRIQQYQLNMPMKATYPQVIAFLSRLYETFPNLAIENISFRREMVENGIPDTEIHLTLYVRSQ